MSPVVGMDDARERYWRSLEELFERPTFREALAREFPASADLPPDWLTRRSFMKLLGASLALAGLGGCVDRPREKILPYVANPPGVTPTEAQHYATAMTLDGYATGLLVESHTGRPTKIEGNSDHPASLGAAGVFEQASILGLYDPQRARSVRTGGRRSVWGAFLATITDAEIRRVAGARGAGLHLLLEPTASPLIAELMAAVRERYPDARIHFYAPLASETMFTGTIAAFGRAAQPIYDFTAADVVLAIDADFLAAMPFQLRYAHDFAKRRRVASPSDAMNRLYVMETALTVTGGVADHRLRSRPTQLPSLVAAIVERVARQATAYAPWLSASLTSNLPEGEHGSPSAWTDAVADDLLANIGRCAVIAGPRQSAAVHGLTQLLNVALGNVGHTVRYVAPPLLPGDADTALVPFVSAMRSGDATCVLVLGGNPVYTAPPELEFGKLLSRIPRSAYLGLYRNETARACQWSIPAQHYLESWGDTRAWDGTASFVQPLVQPLYGGHGEADVLAAIAGETRPAYSLLQASWQRRIGRRDFESFWNHALQRGVVPETAAPAVQVQPKEHGVIELLRQLHEAKSTAIGQIELTWAPDAAVYDGRFANNAWLQEFPDPITALTWGNAAMLSDRTAAKLGVVSGQLIEVTNGGQRINIPALVVPGHADDALTISLGYGRNQGARGDGGEQVAAGVGANGYLLRTLATPYAEVVFVRGLVESNGDARHTTLALTQTHWQMNGRPIVLTSTLEEYRHQPVVAPHDRGRSLSLYEPEKRLTHDQWAMAIDLSTCTGCGACVVACQAENNVPVVGPEGVSQSREMHWLRVDRYFAGTPDDPVVLAQPMLCQHCEKAPCEYVCPVNATVHSPDGINEMVYNRCVGTRFCSNNCPYKVRRFNWFDYNAEVAETERLAKNPNVTVRARGVMEKCTFCVQRVRQAQINARVDDRTLRPDEVRTACQQACPSQAIMFGTLTNPTEEMAQWWDHPRSYSVLHELGTDPRVHYLARITNPNPRLESGRDVPQSR